MENPTPGVGKIKNGELKIKNERREKEQVEREKRKIRAGFFHSRIHAFTPLILH